MTRAKATKRKIDIVEPPPVVGLAWAILDVRYGKVDMDDLDTAHAALREAVAIVEALADVGLCVVPGTPEYYAGLRQLDAAKGTETLKFGR